MTKGDDPRTGLTDPNRQSAEAPERLPWLVEPVEANGVCVTRAPGAENDLGALTAAVADIVGRSPGERILLGISGAPGAGKSTLAWHLCETLEAAGVRAARVPMDGFHLSDAMMESLGRRNRKGAIDTFDGWGYLALLRRLKAERDHPVYAPDFERVIEQPIAAGLAVAPDCQVVVTEGNYLLAPDEPWRGVRDVLTEIWHCTLDDAERHRRLVRRHIRSGKAPAAAEAWVNEVDETNALQIGAWTGRADRIIDTGALGLSAGRD